MQEEEFEEHICKGTLDGDDDLWKTHHATAIVFEGDHYNPDNKTVQIPVGKGWFNLACAGTAVFKMHMLRHTKAGSITPDGTPSKHNTPATDRDAEGDHCGLLR